MNDAELMTTAPDVPGLEVREDSKTWCVDINGEYIGMVFWDNGIGFRTMNKANVMVHHTDRNAAVQWILNQHKVTNNA